MDQVSCDRWQVTGDKWYVTGDRWYLKHDTGHVTCDTWQIMFFLLHISLDFCLSVLLSEHIERLNVSCMRDFLKKNTSKRELIYTSPQKRAQSYSVYLTTIKTKSQLQSKYILNIWKSFCSLLLLLCSLLPAAFHHQWSFLVNKSIFFIINASSIELFEKTKFFACPNNSFLLLQSWVITMTI